LLIGYHVLGTDLSSRMVEFSKHNIQWLFNKYPELEGQVVIEEADAINYSWPPFSAVASELYLGRAYNQLPEKSLLHKNISEVNVITSKFLKNIHKQLKLNQVMVLALPVWLQGNHKIFLPLIENLKGLGYNHIELKHVSSEDLVYYRPGQVVARQLVILKKV
jgi:tRNA G10  N-methylase Trm11